MKPEARIAEDDKQAVFVKVKGGEVLFAFDDEDDAEKFCELVNDWCDWASVV